MQELLKEEKSIGEIASEYGVHPTMLHRWKNTAVDNLSSVFEDEGKNSAAALKKEHEKETTQLYSKIGKLTTQLEWLKKKLASDRTPEERRAMVEPEHLKISVREQAKLLRINRSTLYYQAVDRPDEEVRLKHRIDKIYTDHPA